MSDFYEPWQPKIGQRVRVRLSGECQRPIPNGLDGGGICNFKGHPEAFDGLCGVVDDPGSYRDDPVTARDVDVQRKYGHTYPVSFDQPYRIKPSLVVGGDLFAAIELEPLDDEAQP